MPSHSERVRRNYDPTDSTAQRSQPSEAPEWVDEGTEPIRPRPVPEIPLREDDDSEPVISKF